MSTTSNVQELLKKHIKPDLKAAGYTDIKPLANTLQGAIYSAVQTSTNTNVVVKVTNKYLHENSVTIQNGKFCKVQENILTEAKILKHLTTSDSSPKSIVKYIDWLESKRNYYLVMEHGGTTLFNFIVKSHNLIQIGQITLSHWHKIVKIIFKQMIESVEYIHKNGVCHFDLSLENFLISDVKVEVTTNSHTASEKVEFDLDSIQIKLIDFGLAEMFGNENGQFFSNKYVGKRNYKSPEIIARKRMFNTISNDIWCLGICLFMMLFGHNPWKVAAKEDGYFYHVFIKNDGNISNLLMLCNIYNYIKDDRNIINLFQSLFQFEEERICLKKIKNHSWLK